MNKRIGTINAGHTILKVSEINGTGFALASMETHYGKQYATWQYNPDKDDYYFWGHYFFDSPHIIGDPLYKDPYDLAIRDYFRRISEEVESQFNNL